MGKKKEEKNYKTRNNISFIKNEKKKRKTILHVLYPENIGPKPL